MSDDLVALPARHSYLEARLLPKKKTRIEEIAPASSISTQSRAVPTATKTQSAKTSNQVTKVAPCLQFVAENKLIPVVRCHALPECIFAESISRDTRRSD